MLKLEDIAPKMQLAGVEPSGPVKVIAAELLGTEAINVTYKTVDGALLERTLFRSDEPGLSQATVGLAWSFDADPAAFKLAAEALRIRLAHLFDPMMAVHTSDVDPLPHQISAVYEEMLPRQPLRFVLADDPGAGKTIMAGLLIRELMARGDLERCLVVAPGGLVDQWQEELQTKFGVPFDILTHQLVESTTTGNPFVEKPLLIARLDQLARNEAWQEKLKSEHALWDLVIFDEAHKLSATWFGSERKTTKRYNLAYEILTKPEHARNVLLMTATPHNGKEEDFQLFLALVDQDRFYGKARKGGGRVDASDLMRRMVKEDLVKFDRTPLFPERRASTIRYTLSPAEKLLYENVTEYVRSEMGKAEKLLDNKRKGTVGFALTILQRRLASSPRAIYESLRRRRERLQGRLKDMRAIVSGESGGFGRAYAGLEYDHLDDYLDELSASELEALEEDVIDEATAAKTIPELETEILALRELEEEAARVLHSGHDRKWDELSKILQNDDELLTKDGRRRKLIVFTEHKDTLVYLEQNIRRVLGNPRAVVTIHGGTRREERLSIQEAFRQDPEVVVLVATDAAGEGVNLQNANLMVNYDLPWNPNRLEQRFGRIHRIGQTEVCHLWNLVAIETREGEVFDRLFHKLDVARQSLRGRVFDVLGQEVFEETSLRDLLIQAIRYGEREDVRAQLYEKVDRALDVEHLEGLIRRNALTADVMSPEHLFSIKEQMEKAEARKLQPFYLRRFLFEAFEPLGGELREREPGRYEIRHVPAMVRKRNAIEGSRVPVLEKYERVTFDRHLTRVHEKPVADLLHPGHPLMGAVLDLTLERVRPALREGTLLVDPLDEGTVPRVLFILEHGIREGGTPQRLASQRMVMVEIDAAGEIRTPPAAPYLDYVPLTADERPLADKVRDEPWLKQDLEHVALSYAAERVVPSHMAEVKDRRETYVKKTREAVWERLTREINYWSAREQELLLKVQAGKQPKMQPINARRTAEELKARRELRIKQLEEQLHLSSNPPRVLGGALVLPRGLLDRMQGKAPALSSDAAARKRIEQLAMKAVFDAERALGNATKDVSKENCGWDITSIPPEGETRHIEVKGRQAGADSIYVTQNEVLTALNQGDKFLLAIVLVHDDDSVSGPHYIRAPFTQEPEPGMVAIEMGLKALLAKAKPPGEA